MFLLKEKIIGLDISDHTIEAAELVSRHGRIDVTAISRVQLEPGVIEHGRIKNVDKLSQAITLLFSQAKPNSFSSKNINFALPNSQLFSHVFHLKNNLDSLRFSEEEMEGAVLEEARTNIPVEEKDLIFSYKILSQKKDELEIFLIAADKQVVMEWKNFFKNQKLDIDYFDAETLATFRGIFNNIPPNPVCLVDMGEMNTNVSIFDGHGLRYSRLINVAGKTFSDKLAQELKIDFEQAEAIKINQGLEGKNLVILNDSLKNIASDIKESLDYFQYKTGQAVEGIFLVGGSSKLKGLIEYLQTKIGVGIQLGNSEIFQNKIPLFYIEAVGLAIRSFDKKWENRDPIINLKNIEEADGGKKEKSVFNFINQEQASSFDTNKSPNLKKQKIILIIAVVIGLVSFLSALWYKNVQEDKKQEELKNKISQFSQEQSFVLEIPVAISEEEYTADRVRGRMIEYKIDPAGNYSEGLKISEEEAKKTLKSGEILWPEEFNTDQSIKWFAYLEKDADSLFLSKLKELNTENTEYILSSIEKIDLKATDNGSIFILSGRLTIFSQKLINIPEVSSRTENKGNTVGGGTDGNVISVVLDEGQNNKASSSAVETINKVLIKATPTGWLNVRQGPGKEYNVVFRAYPGESYEALEKEGEWQKIKTNDGQEGWVSVEYIQ